MVYELEVVDEVLPVLLTGSLVQHSDPLARRCITLDVRTQVSDLYMEELHEVVAIVGLDLLAEDIFVLELLEREKVLDLRVALACEYVQLFYFGELLPVGVHSKQRPQHKIYCARLQRLVEELFVEDYNSARVVAIHDLRLDENDVNFAREVLHAAS